MQGDVSTSLDMTIGEGGLKMGCLNPTLSYSMGMPDSRNKGRINIVSVSIWMIHFVQYDGGEDIGLNSSEL